MASVKRKDVKTQQLLTSMRGIAEQTIFFEDLCHAMVASGIPLWNLQKTPFKDFLAKYTNNKIPDESTLRKNYLPICYNKTIEKIKNELVDNYLYLIVDETTDPRGIYVANLLVGVLSPNGPKNPFLVCSKHLEKTNYETICRFINDGLKFISTGSIENKVLLFISDAAPYMVKAGQSLKIFYFKMIHVTCIAHACNRLAEKIREIFPHINKLINNGKKMFLKAPSRVDVYKELMLGKPLPPQPVITRWGTWLAAAVFYAENFLEFKSVVLKIAEVDDALCVQKVHELLKTTNTGKDLAFIYANCKFLLKIIEDLERRGIALSENINIIDNLKTHVNQIPGEKGNLLKNKLKHILEKNPGLADLCKINKILQGDEVDVMEEIEPIALSSFKYAPITSVDVERSFSKYKTLLSDKRYNFKEVNFEMLLVVNYNAN